MKVRINKQLLQKHLKMNNKASAGPNMKKNKLTIVHKCYSGNQLQVMYITVVAIQLSPSAGLY